MLIRDFDFYYCYTNKKVQRTSGPTEPVIHKDASILKMRIRKTANQNMRRGLGVGRDEGRGGTLTFPDFRAFSNFPCEGNFKGSVGWKTGKLVEARKSEIYSKLKFTLSEQVSST